MVRNMMMLALTLGATGLAPMLAVASTPVTPALPGPLEKVSPYIGPLIKILPLVLDPGDISSKRHAEVVAFHSEGQSKLIVSTSTIQVIVKKTHEKWSGNYYLTMKTPCKVSYSLDLASVGALPSAWDAGRKQLKIKMPGVQVYAIEPLLDQRQFIFKRTGLRWSSSGVEAQLREAALEEVEPEARRHALAEAAGIHSQAADRFRQIVQSKLRMVVPEAQVATD